MYLNSAKCSLGISLAVLFYTMKCNIGPFVNTFHNKEVMCEQKAHRWPQSAKLCPEQAERRAKRHRIQHGAPFLSLFPWYGSPSLYLSLVNPFTVIRAFQHFLFFCRSELWEIISVRLLADCTQKAALESRFLLQQRLKSSGWLFSFFFPSPGPQRHTYHATPSAKKNRKEEEWHIENRKILPFSVSIVHQGRKKY